MRLADSPDINDEVVTEVVQSLTRANDALAVGQLQVGFRVRDEVALFCLNARDCSEAFVQSDQAIVSPLDICLSMKILPRIQGGGALVREVLDELEAWCQPAASDGNALEDPAGFPRTLERIQMMKRRLDQTGFTSYWV